MLTVQLVNAREERDWRDVQCAGELTMAKAICAIPSASSFCPSFSAAAPPAAPVTTAEVMSLCLLPA